MPICLVEEILSDLRDELVQVLVGGPTDVQAPLADLVDGLIVHEEGAVDGVHAGVRSQDRVVRLHHGRRHLRRRVHRKVQSRFPVMNDRNSVLRPRFP